MNQINPMNYWNDFAKEMNELTTRNLEVMNKFWGATSGQNDEILSKNMETYFNYLNTNVNYLNTLWQTHSKNNVEFRETFRQNMEETYSKFVKIAREISQAQTQSQTK